MNRIAPASSVLYVANTDGSNERQLLSSNSTAYDYHASFSPDGQWITFTSERAGDGQSDIYRVRTNGSDLEELVATPSFEDGGVLSPHGTTLAYVSTQGNYTANIWVKNLQTKEVFNLTNTTSTAGNNASPSGRFRPNWSPHGEWIAFSSTVIRTGPGIATVQDGNTPKLSQSTLLDQIDQTSDKSFPRMGIVLDPQSGLQMALAFFSMR
ncbi:hypothetical protein ACMFMG_003678 [Clarireedia jacksonii]